MTTPIHETPSAAVLLHKQAMEVADLAQFALNQGKPNIAQQFFAQAYTVEAEAATATSPNNLKQYLILHRSAGALALCAGFNVKAAAHARLIYKLGDEALREFTGVTKFLVSLNELKISYHEE